MEITPKKYAVLEAQLVRRVIETGVAEEFEKEYVRKDGSHVPILLNVFQVKNEANELIGFGAILKDITERKKAEEKLVSQETLYRTLVDTIPNIIWTADSEGKARFFNQAWKDLTGREGEESLGDKWAESVHPDDIKGLLAKWERAYRHGEPYNVECRLKAEDGSYRAVTVSGTPVRDASGKIVNWVGINNDITERKRAEEQIVEAKELGDALTEIDVAVTSTLDADEIMQKAIGKANQAMGTDTAVITEREEEEWLIKYIDGRLPQSVVGTTLSDERLRGSMMAVETHRAVVCNDAYHDQRFNRELLQHYGISSFLVVPLLVKERIIGTFAFFHHDEAIPFSKAQIDFSSRLATSVSLAIENARLYSEQRNIADTLQETFLTVPQRIEGLDFGHLYRAATEVARVGGDFFDLFELEEDRVGILVGDVSGKGLEAAKMTSMIKNTIHAHSHEEDSPAQILEKTNRSACKTIPSGSFATVFLGILDTTTGVLTYCNAGHPPPIVRRTAGRSSSLAIGNTPIGVFEEADYIDRKTKLKDGDVLFAYTDGLIEARHDSQLYGEKRLRKAVKELTSIPAPEFPRIIFNKVTSFSNGKLADDVAILSVSLKTRRGSLEQLAD